eukprot:1639244-Pleurochrysis_carterae.AAC.1
MEDLSQLPSFNEAAAVEQLRQRYEKKRIYTRVAKMLIAINPYEELGLYEHAVQQMYRLAGGQTCRRGHEVGHARASD